MDQFNLNDRSNFDNVRIDEVLEEEINLDQQSTFASPINEFIKKTNTAIAGGLAISLWVMLVITVVWHIWSISQLNQKFWSDTNKLSDAQVKMEKSLSAISDTAKTLYAVITPIAVTITGFYFQTSSSSDDSS